MKAMSYHPLERESVNINTDDDMKSLQRLRMASSVLDGDTGCTDANVLLPFYERVDLEESRASVLGDIEAILRRRGRREGSTKIMVMATLLFDEYSSRWAQEFNLVDYKLLALGCMCIAWKQQDGSEPSDIKDLLPKWCTVQGMSEVQLQISASVDCRCRGFTPTSAIGYSLQQRRRYHPIAAVFQTKGVEEGRRSHQARYGGPQHLDVVLYLCHCTWFVACFDSFR